ncbi:MAG: hypothetical protein MJ136_04345 [Clostridia bacterium]|nr:hypothetical protein [Clostridia bacterium]
MKKLLTALLICLVLMGITTALAAVTSSDEAVVTVEGTSVLVPAGAGEATVTWTDDNGTVLGTAAVKVDENNTLTILSSEVKPGLAELLSGEEASAHAFSETAEVVGDFDVFSCTDCGACRVLVHVHTWGKWKTLREATCLRQGEERRICQVCRYVEYHNFGTDTGHVVDWTWDGDISHYGVCAGCGEEITERCNVVCKYIGDENHMYICTICGTVYEISSCWDFGNWGDWVEGYEDASGTWHNGYYPITCTVCGHSWKGNPPQ